MTLLTGDVPAPAPVRNYRRLLLILIPSAVLIFGLFVYGSYRAIKGFMAAQRESALLLDHLHQQMNAGDYAGIYDAADSGYKKNVTREQSDKLFSGLEKRLGAVSSTTAQNTQIQATTTGHYITTTFRTQFANDPAATETLTWRKDGDTYRLFNYHIQSKALLE